MPSALADTLKSFDATEANLEKLERIWRELKAQIPVGVVLGESGPRYDELSSAYREILKAMPGLEGWLLKDELLDLDAIGQMRLDAKELAEDSGENAVEERIFLPERSLREYRSRLTRLRRRAIRAAAQQQLEAIGALLAKIGAKVTKRKRANTSLDGPDWDDLRGHVTQLQTLLGRWTPKRDVWNDFHRHLGFAMVCDFRDIAGREWPSIRQEVTARLIHEDEPIPVAVADLGGLAAAKPTGPVPTRLQWANLSPEDFERLVFALLVSTGGYEGAQWLTRTQASDRGRDISVCRVHQDALAGAIRTRVIFQCKHWQRKSVTPDDIASARNLMPLNEPPRVDVLVIVTSGRFTAAAVDVVEKHNQSDRALRIEMWAESHLETLLASQPSLVAEFGLR